MYCISKIDVTIIIKAFNYLKTINTHELSRNGSCKKLPPFLQIVDAINKKIKPTKKITTN